MAGRCDTQLLSVHDALSAETHVIWLLVGETLEPRKALVCGILAGLLQQEMLLVVLAARVVWQDARRSLRPLRQSSETVAGRGTDEFAPLPQQGLSTEAAPLVEAISRCVVRLLCLMHVHKRLSADATHQLKTPLAVIQTQSELALHEPGGEYIRRHLKPLRDTIRQATCGVQQLLSLSCPETDSGYAPQLQPLRLDTLAGDVALEPAPVARKSSADLGFGGESVMMVGESQWLQELVDNLLDNIILYANKGACVTLRARQQATPILGEQTTLQMEDDGPGIIAPKHNTAFGCLYCGTASESYDGNGLGLAIVQEIVRLHGGTVALSDTPGGGLTVSVYLAFALPEEHPA